MLPKTIYVYVCDYNKDKPIYAIAEDVDEIPEDCNGETVSIFTRTGSRKFTVGKTLR